MRTLHADKDSTVARTLVYPCRQLGTSHAFEQCGRPGGWTPPQSDAWRGAWAVIHWRCPRCATTKHMPITAAGIELLTQPRYEWPDGYLLGPGEEPPAREETLLHMARSQRDADRATARKAPARRKRAAA